MKEKSHLKKTAEEERIRVEQKRQTDRFGRMMDTITVQGKSGFSFDIELTRGMDISSARLENVNISYLAKEKLLAAEKIYATEYRKARFFFGLLSTCGLENTGQESEDEDGVYCLHGSINYSPAQSVRVYKDCGKLIVEGEITSIFERWSALVLFRRIIYDDEHMMIRVEDEVRNTGKHREQVCVMYHYNFGAPFLDKTCEMEIPISEMIPKNQTAQEMLPEWQKICGETEGYPPHVFYCTLKKDKNGFSKASLINKRLGLKASVIYDAATLPKMDIWKRFSNEQYVMAYEPCNAYPVGRCEQRQQEIACYLPPAESVKYVTGFQIERIKG